MLKKIAVISSLCLLSCKSTEECTDPSNVERYTKDDVKMARPKFSWMCTPAQAHQLPKQLGIERLRYLNDEGLWLELIDEVYTYKSKYPYGEHNVEADLLQANAWYQRGDYPEAIAAYDDIITRNPKIPQAELAAYRIAQSYDRQSPEEIDREQGLTADAVRYYRLFKANFPDTQYKKEVNERIEILTRRLADHNAFIANFYWKKDIFHSALKRYLYIIDNFKQFQDLQNIAYNRAAVAYEKLAEDLEENPEKKQKIDVYRKNTPTSLRQQAALYKAKKQKTIKK